MSETLEHFGAKCKLPEPVDETADCKECGKPSHPDYKVVCVQCGQKRCATCMLLDTEALVYFCDTSTPETWQLPRAKRLLVSECREEYLKGKNGNL